jgi:hypothetical protein
MIGPPLAGRMEAYLGYVEMKTLLLLSFLLLIGWVRLG